MLKFRFRKSSFENEMHLLDTEDNDPSNSPATASRSRYMGLDMGFGWVCYKHRKDPPLAHYFISYKLKSVCPVMKVFRSLLIDVPDHQFPTWRKLGSI